MSDETYGKGWPTWNDAPNWLKCETKPIKKSPFVRWKDRKDAEKQAQISTPDAPERMFILVNASSERWNESPKQWPRECYEGNPKPSGPWQGLRTIPNVGLCGKTFCTPDTVPLGSIDGLADWLDRQKAAGNGQVPSVVKLAWQTLIGE